jgi:hypothetical protein
MTGSSSTTAKLWKLALALRLPDNIRNVMNRLDKIMLNSVS